MALESLKDAVTGTPVLRYFNVKEDVTLQCDASQSGLGAALLQNRQPLAYASRALTPAEARYSQIEKELLLILFVCERFDSYIYGLEGIKEAFGVNFPKASSRRSAATTKDATASPEIQLSDSIQEGQGNVPGGYSQLSTLPEISACEFVDELEEIDHKEFVPVSRLQ